MADVLARPKLRAYAKEQEAPAFIELVRTEANGLDVPTPSGLALTSDADDELATGSIAAAAQAAYLPGDLRGGSGGSKLVRPLGHRKATRGANQ